MPVISDMYLEIGGIRYPAAPFNGWYMCIEIGSRDLGDTGRYDQLPVIARRLGLSTASDRTLWKDKASTELSLAVLHSFCTAGVTISDHHTESVPPVFHRYGQDFDQGPHFYRHPAPGPKSLPGQADVLTRAGSLAAAAASNIGHLTDVSR